MRGAGWRLLVLGLRDRAWIPIHSISVESGAAELATGEDGAAFDRLRGGARTGDLVEMNHSLAFWSVVERACPDYRKCRAEFRSYGVAE